jgi:hypothetical protein
MIQLISSTPKAGVDRLDDHDSWPSIIVILRLLFMLSFENCIYVQQYLPELFHIVMMLFSSGNSYIRSTTHGLLINILHSLYTITVTNENKLQGLRYFYIYSTIYNNLDFIFLK